MAEVFAGMSGGIDSSAAAFLLKEEGHSVTGVTFTAFQEEGYKKCCSIEEITAAKSVCSFLGIPHKIIDVKDVFQAKIIQNFIKSYQAGLTPNPCVLCNRYVKFGALLEYSLSQGAEFFATGHYAGVIKQGGDFLIEKGLDPSKDQSYFLSYIEKNKLPFIKLPLGGYHKKEIRSIVEKAKLPISPHKAESQDICFIKDDYREFLRTQGVIEKEGSFIYQDKKAGIHKGIPFYSFGQRRGLNVAAGERVYIREFDVKNNTIKLGEKPLSKEFNVKKLNIFTDKFIAGRYGVQVRYQSAVIDGDVKIKEDSAHVELDRPHEIITPGQFAVFYKGDFVYASGEIERVVLL